jgi:hypothetical protein
MGVEHPPELLRKRIMSIGHDEFEYNRGAVRPLLCYRDGWRLIKDHYFLFFGITTLGLLIAYSVPFGVLVGPVWCGFEICLFCCMAGQRPIAAPPSTDIRGEAPLARPPETGITPGPPPE